MNRFVAAICFVLAVLAMPAFSNTTSTAIPVQLNSTANLSLTSISDIEYLSITLSSDGYLTVRLHHDILNSANNSWVVSVINTSNQTLLSYGATYANTDTSNSVGLPAGTYYVKVVFNDTCSYCTTNTSLINQQFQIGVDFTAGQNYEKVPNNTAALATTAALNTTYTGSLKSITDYAYYKITLPSDGYVTATLSHALMNSANNSWQISIINPSNQTIMSYAATYANPSTAYSIGLAAGTYYVKIVFTDTCSYCTNTGLIYQPFNISVGFVAGQNYEKKPNSTAGTATPIVFNTAYTGTLMSLTDYAYFSFVLPTGTSITSTFSHRLLNSANNKWAVSIIDSQNQSVMSYTSDYTQQTYSKTGALAAGTYYVKVVFNDLCSYCTNTSLLNEPFSITVSTNGVATADADRVFNWAESSYPGFFPKGSPTQTALNYRYRYYSSTNTYLAATRDDFLVVDNGSNWDLLTIGRVSTFLPLAVGAGF